MKKLQDAAAWCPHCESRLRILVTQPYRDRTWRVEFHCREFYQDCPEAGIVMLMEIKNED